MNDESDDRRDVNYPKAQSRPEDTAGIKQQRKTAWIFVVLILLAFLFVSSQLMH